MDTFFSVSCWEWSIESYFTPFYAQKNPCSKLKWCIQHLCPHCLELEWMINWRTMEIEADHKVSNTHKLENTSLNPTTINCFQYPTWCLKNQGGSLLDFKSSLWRKKKRFLHLFSKYVTKETDFLLFNRTKTTLQQKQTQVKTKSAKICWNTGQKFIFSVCHWCQVSLLRRERRQPALWPSSRRRKEQQSWTGMRRGAGDIWTPHLSVSTSTYPWNLSPPLWFGCRMKDAAPHQVLLLPLLTEEDHFSRMRTIISSSNQSTVEMICAWLRVNIQLDR